MDTKQRYRVAFSRPRFTIPSLCCACGGAPGNDEYEPKHGGRRMPLCPDCAAEHDSLDAMQRLVNDTQMKGERAAIIAGVAGAAITAGVAASNLKYSPPSGIFAIACVGGVLARIVAKWFHRRSRASRDAASRLALALERTGGPPFVYRGPAVDGEEYEFACEPFARAIAAANELQYRPVECNPA